MLSILINMIVCTIITGQKIARSTNIYQSFSKKNIPLVISGLKYNKKLMDE